jgi:hypothetical protein
MAILEILGSSAFGAGLSYLLTHPAQGKPGPCVPDFLDPDKCVATQLICTTVFGTSPGR